MSGYDPIAEDYHWLVPDGLLSGGTFAEGHGDLLAALPPGASILDCACGIGSEAIALARQGFRVFGTDASEGLVARARGRAREAGVEVPFAARLWEELPDHFGEGSFDLVLCLGNSISHSPDKDTMLRSLGAMRRVLKAGGTLAVDSRNWEKLRRERPRLSAADKVVERDGARCVPVRLWSFPETWDEPHRMDVALLFLDGRGNVTQKLHPIEYRPVREGELRARTEEAGFVEARTSYEEDADWYEVRARRPDARAG